jgi:hypothetical protein
VGYRQERTPYRLYFADGKYEGLEVFMKSVSVGKLMKMINIQSKLPDDPKKIEPTVLDDLFDVMGSALDSWNVEDDDGSPIPADLSGLYELDVVLLMDILGGWIEGMVNIPAPLASTSPDGLPSLAAEIPTETLSASQ